MKLSNTIEILNPQTIVQNSKLINLKKLIAVKEPYYALTNLEQINDELSASIPLELTTHMEPYGMSIPEIGRHMAILGSLALANTNPKKEKHYYLATHAIVEKAHKNAGGDGLYIGKVKVLSFTKRVGIINGELYNAFGELYATIVVEYAVLHELVFERMFGAERQTTNFDSIKNPYCKPSHLSNANIGYKNSSASLGNIKQDDCAGHFKDFAALPIARLGGALTSLSGLHYNLIRNSNQKYNIRKAEINAKSFVFAGKELNLISQLTSDINNNEICIESFASTTECENVVDYKLWFY